jgi:hypothetical protein
MPAFAGVDGAMAGIEQRAVFQQAHGFGHRVQRRAAGIEHGLAGRDDVGQRLVIAGLVLGRERSARDGACAAMDGNYRSGHALVFPLIERAWQGRHGLADRHGAAALLLLGQVQPGQHEFGHLCRRLHRAACAMRHRIAQGLDQDQCGRIRRGRQRPWVWAYIATSASGTSGEPGVSVMRAPVRPSPPRAG